MYKSIFISLFFVLATNSVLAHPDLELLDAGYVYKMTIKKPAVEAEGEEPASPQPARDILLLVLEVKQVENPSKGLLERLGLKKPPNQPIKYYVGKILYVYPRAKGKETEIEGLKAAIDILDAEGDAVPGASIAVNHQSLDGVVQGEVKTVYQWRTNKQLEKAGAAGQLALDNAKKFIAQVNRALMEVLGNIDTNVFQAAYAIGYEAPALAKDALDALAAIDLEGTFSQAIWPMIQSAAKSADSTNMGALVTEVVSGLSDAIPQNKAAALEQLSNKISSAPKLPLPDRSMVQSWLEKLVKKINEISVKMAALGLPIPVPDFSGRIMSEAKGLDERTEKELALFAPDLAAAITLLLLPAGDNLMGNYVKMARESKSKENKPEDYVKSLDEDGRAKARAAYYNLLHIKSLVMKVIAGQKATNDLIKYMGSFVKVAKTRMLQQAETALVEGMKTGAIAGLANISANERGLVTTRDLQNRATKVIKTIKDARSVALKAIKIPDTIGDISSIGSAVGAGVESVGLLSKLSNLIKSVVTEAKMLGKDIIFNLLSWGS